MAAQQTISAATIALNRSALAPKLVEVLTELGASRRAAERRVRQIESPGRSVSIGWNGNLEGKSDRRARER
jgi:hypothetical protein